MFVVDSYKERWDGSFRNAEVVGHICVDFATHSRGEETKYGEYCHMLYSE